MDDKKMILACLIALGVLLAGVWTGRSQAQGDQDSDNLKRILSTLDSTVVFIRGGGDIASRSPSPISVVRDNYWSAFSSRVDNALDNNIRQALDSLGSKPSEENILAIRADIVAAVSPLGVSISPVYGFSIFIILAVSVLVSLLVTLFTKRMVKWDTIREAKAKVSEFTKEYKDAQFKRDMKRLHKLEQRKAEISKLQGAMASQNMKPTIIYSIPLLLLWIVLGTVYSGWVVAWLPFRIDLPVFGPLVAFGFGWWYFITYLGFSQVFRKILIRDEPLSAPKLPAAPAKTIVK